jgi:hypothetical protein
VTTADQRERERLSQLTDHQVQVISRDPCPKCDVRALTGYQMASQYDCQSCGAVIPLDKPIPRLRIADVQKPIQSPVVYYIQFGDRVKIGTTANLPQRLAALPHDRVLATEPGGFELEQARHRQLRASRVDGQREWFHLTDQVRQHVAGLRGRA